MAKAKPKSLFWLWVIPLLLLISWLGARGLNADPIWFDEHFSIYVAGGGPYGPLSPEQIWERIATEDPWHPPLYFILLNAWAGLVGWEPPALRALSVFGGLLAIAWTYRLGRSMVSARAGLYAAVVMGVSAFFVYYLHELRNYTLFSLLTAYTLWAYWRIVSQKKEPSRLLCIALLAGVAMTLYIHYFAALVLVAIGLYHLLFARKNRRWWQVVGVMALGGLLYVPWLTALLSAINQIGDDELVRRTAATTPQILERLAYLLGNGSVMLVVVSAVLALSARQRGAQQVWFFTVSLLALSLLLNTILPLMPITRMRYLLGLWPLLGLVIALGINQLWRWLPRLVIGIWLALSLAANLDPNFISSGITDGAGWQWQIFPWHIARDPFLLRSQPGDALVLNVPDGIGRLPLPEYQIPEFYLNGSGVRIGVIGSQSTPAQDDAAIESALAFASESPRVWVAFEPQRRSTVLPRFESALSEAYGLCQVGIAQTMYQFDLYSRSPVCCMPDAAPPLMRFGDGIALVGLDALPDTVADTLPLTLSWTIASSVPPNTYSVALHVLDADDNLVAQADYGLPPSSAACQETEISMENLPEGEYDLVVIMYAWATGERLTGEVTTTGERGERLLLGTFNISR